MRFIHFFDLYDNGRIRSGRVVDPGSENQAKIKIEQATSTDVHLEDEDTIKKMKINNEDETKKIYLLLCRLA